MFFPAKSAKITNFDKKKTYFFAKKRNFHEFYELSNRGNCIKQHQIW